MTKFLKNILILAANPVGTDRIRLDMEVRAIDEGLKRSEYRDQFMLRQKWAVQPVDVHRALLEYNPQIVHFSGHGIGDVGILLEREDNQVTLVDADALAGLFELFPSIECVVLNACYSHIQAKAISNHIKYVVGLPEEIEDTMAIKFAIGFYDAIGAKKNYDFAYRLGCSAMQMAGLSKNLMPTLLTTDMDAKVHVNDDKIEIDKNLPKLRDYSYIDMVRLESYTAQVNDSPAPISVPTLYNNSHNHDHSQSTKRQNNHDVRTYYEMIQYLTKYLQGTKQLEFKRQSIMFPNENIQFCLETCEARKVFFPSDILACFMCCRIYLYNLVNRM